jgi:2-iminobutanoate/2-iminopropanoate deaminase
MNKKAIKTDQAPAPIGPYNQAILANGTLYVSGQMAVDSQTGEMVNENLTEETHQVMKNLDAILREAGMTFNNVVKCSIFIKDMKLFSTLNDAYGQYFTDIPPARETVEVADLPKHVNVEISCIAIQ